MRIEPTIYKQKFASENQKSLYSAPSSLNSAQPQLEGLFTAKLLLILCWAFPFAVAALLLKGYPLTERLPELYLYSLVIISSIIFFSLLGIIFQKLNRRVWLWMLISISIPFAGYTISFICALFLKPQAQKKA